MKINLSLIVVVFIASLFASCTKDDSKDVAPSTFPYASITTSAITSITSTGATTGGTISSDGGTLINARGVCYAAHSHPQAWERNVLCGSGSGTFAANITGLSKDSEYFVCAYAVNSAGTAYGNEQHFIAAYTIGQNFQGGVIFYVDNADQHGFIAAPGDQSAAAVWGCSGTKLNGANGQGLGTGPQNTADIVNGCSTAGIAARLCTGLTQGGYNDWFLPSNDELQLLYAQRNIVGGFSTSYYWTSYQLNADSAYSQNFSTGSSVAIPKSNNASVRAIRSF